jgi:hypothetical protein
MDTVLTDAIATAQVAQQAIPLRVTRQRGARRRYLPGKGQRAWAIVQHLQSTAAGLRLSPRLEAPHTGG